MSYKGASNLESAESPKEKMNKFSSRSTRSRKKFDIKFSKYRTVSKSKSETDSEDNVKEILTIIYPKEQFSKQHIKCPRPMCYKEASDTDDDKSLKENTNKLFFRNTRSRKKCEAEVTVSKSKRKSNSEESVEEIITIFYPKKQFSKQRLKHPTSFSYKEASNSEGDESSKEKMIKFSSQGTPSCKQSEAQFSKFVTVSKSKSETDSENIVREIQTKTSRKKQFSKRRIKCPTPMSYKEASNSESNDSPEEKMTKFFSLNTRSRKKCEVQSSKYITVSKSKRKTNSEDSGEEIITIISPQKQFSNQHIKCPTLTSYKEASSSEGAESSEENIFKFSSRSTQSRKKLKPHFFKQVTASKSKSETGSVDSVEKIPTIISPKKWFSIPHITCPSPMSYKEATNSEGDESPKENMTKFSLRSTGSHNSKHVTVSKSKSETDSGNNVKEMQTKIARKKRFSKRRIKCPAPMSYKEASSSECDESPKEKIATPSSWKLPNFENLTKFKKGTYCRDDLCSAKSCNEASYMESQPGISLASEEDDEDELNGLFGKMNREFRKCAKTGKRKLVFSSSKSIGEEVLVKAKRKLTCKMVEKVNANSQPIVKKKVMCTNSSKWTTGKSSKEVLERIDNKPAIDRWNARQCSVMLTPIKKKNDNYVIRRGKEVILKEDYVPETQSNKCRVRQCSVPLTPINVKSDNNKMNRCVKDQVILSKDCAFETRDNTDMSDKITKAINCCILSSESHSQCKVTKIKSADSLKLFPCSIVLSPIHLENANFYKSTNVFKSKKGLENTTKVAQCEESKNTATQMLDTNELSVKGPVLDTFLQPCFVTLIKLPIFPEGYEIGKFKTVTFESEHSSEKQTEADLLPSLNKSNKTSVLASKNKDFVECVNTDSFAETFNCIPCSVRLTRCKNANFSKSNLMSLDPSKSTEEIALDTPNKKNSFQSNAVNKNAKKYNSILNSKFRFRKKRPSQNSTDVFASVKKVSSKKPKRNALKSRNTYKSCVNGDNTDLHHLKNAEDNVFGNDSNKSKSFQIDYMNNNAEEDPFCNSEDQLTSEKKDWESPKKHTLFPDIESILNGVSENPSPAGFESNVKPETSDPVVVARSHGNVLSMGDCGMQSNDVELESETGVGKQPRYFHSKKVSRSLKDSIKRRKVSPTNTSSEEWNIKERHNNPDCRRLLRHGENSKKASILLSRKKVCSCFMCVQCNQTVSSSRALYEHLCSGKRKEGYLCYICEKIFKLRSQLMKHKRFHLSRRIDLDENLLA